MNGYAGLLTLTAYIGTASILLAYALGDRKAFDICNACSAPALVLVAVLAHAYPNAVISGAFGLIAGWNLLSDWRLARRPAPRREDYLEADPWDGAQPFKGIPYTVNPNVPEGRMYVINRDNLKFEPVIWDDMVKYTPADIDTVSRWWEITKEQRSPDARIIVITGTHKGPGPSAQMAFNALSPEAQASLRGEHIGENPNGVYDDRTPQEQWEGR